MRAGGGFVIADRAFGTCLGAQWTKDARAEIDRQRFKDTACVGHTSTQAEQPSVQREESSFGLPRNLSGTDAALMSGITGCPSARRTVTELGARNFICIYSP